MDAATSFIKGLFVSSRMNSSRSIRCARIVPVIDGVAHLGDDGGVGSVLGPYHVCSLPLPALLHRLSGLALLEVFGTEYSRLDEERVARESFVTVFPQEECSAVFFAGLPSYEQSVVSRASMFARRDDVVAPIVYQLSRLQQHKGLYDQLCLSQPGVRSVDLGLLERSLTNGS